MPADVELLPLPGRLNDSIDAYVHNPFAAAKIGAMVRAYARANVLHHTAAQAAEIEALRAEVAEAREGWHMANGTADLAMKHRDAAESRAERLAEALQGAVDDIADWGEPAKGAHVERIHQQLKAALLRDQEEGK